MKNYVCIILTHGDLAFQLYEVTQKFLALDIPVYLYSNKKDSIETIVQDAAAKLKETRPEHVIIFVDLVGGSCWRAAAGIKKEYENVALLGGVNLPALVSLATNINRLEWPQLLVKIEEDAVKAIKVIK